MYPTLQLIEDGNILDCWLEDHASPSGLAGAGFSCRNPGLLGALRFLLRVAQMLGFSLQRCGSGTWPQAFLMLGSVTGLSYFHPLLHPMIVSPAVIGVSLTPACVAGFQAWAHFEPVISPPSL